MILLLTSTDGEKFRFRKTLSCLSHPNTSAVRVQRDAFEFVLCSLTSQGLIDSSTTARGLPFYPISRTQD